MKSTIHKFKKNNHKVLGKRFFSLLVLVMFLNGCDDGDLKVESLDFTTAAAMRCENGNIIYKLNDTEALFFEVASYDEVFINDVTPDGSPIVLPVNADNRIFYRAYNGHVGTDNICETIQPGTPSITEQWTVSDGNIEIVTTAVKIPNTITGFTGGEKIQKFRHTITFRNITFVKPTGSQVEQEYLFGDYDTFPTTLPFNFDDEVEKCDSSNIIYNTNGSEAITLDIDPALIQNAVTPIGTPRTGLISSTSNEVTYRFFNGLITSDYFCTTPTPATPTILEQWNAVDGIAGISGIIEVSTTTNGTGFLHEIHLKKVTLMKGNTSFLLADDYLLGSLITN